jgi:hypothetical protein
MRCRHVRDEDSVVSVDEDQSQQTPSSNDNSKGCDLTRNVTTCQSHYYLIVRIVYYVKIANGVLP